MLFLNFISYCFINTTIFRSNNQNITIDFCIISVLFTFSGNGGAIFINEGFNIYINNTMFYQCMTSNGNGGAFYFENGLECQLNRICAVYCQATSGHFAYISVLNEKIDRKSVV